jgi:hypothetical protein
LKSRGITIKEQEGNKEHEFGDKIMTMGWRGGSFQSILNDRKSDVGESEKIQKCCV